MENYSIEEILIAVDELQSFKKDKSTIFNPENIKNFYLSSSMSPSIKFNFKEVKL